MKYESAKDLKTGVRPDNEPKADWTELAKLCASIKRTQPGREREALILRAREAAKGEDSALRLVARAVG